MSLTDKIMTKDKLVKINEHLRKCQEIMQEIDKARKAGIEGLDATMTYAEDTCKRLTMLKDTYFSQEI